MSLHGIANTSGIEGFTFKTAVSVAPVTDWRYYDSIYTERFMSTPADNPEGYFTTSVNNVRTHLLCYSSNVLCREFTPFQVPHCCSCTAWLTTMFTSRTVQSLCWLLFKLVSFKYGIFVFEKFRLMSKDVQFDTMYYPNNNHAINSGNARPYLYQKMLAFLQHHL